MGRNNNKLFGDDRVNLSVLKKNAFNYRWATVEDGVIPLTAADPDFPVASVVTEAIKMYADQGYFSYGPPNGLPQFREAISKWYLETKSMHFEPDCILPVNSAAFGLFLAAKTILRPGDKAIIPDPVDFLFRKSIENAGAEVVTTALNKIDASYNWLDIEEKLDDHVKAIFVCNPNNPLGKKMSHQDIKMLGKLSEKHNLWIIVDEIWADISYDGSISSLASELKGYEHKIITVSGVSKNFGLAGLRVGYVCVSDITLYQELFRQSKASTTAYGVSTLSQIAAAAALNEADGWLYDFKRHLLQMRNYTEQRIAHFPFFESNLPDSTYLCFPKLVEMDMSSEKFCEKSLKEAKVALVPGGKDWFEQGSEGHVRICYATSKRILQEAFDRLEKLI